MFMAAVVGDKENFRPEAVACRFDLTPDSDIDLSCVTTTVTRSKNVNRTGAP
jgi:hypothetical protein